jgi:hypothetical protein
MFSNGSTAMDGSDQSAKNTQTAAQHRPTSQTRESQKSKSSRVKQAQAKTSVGPLRKNCARCRGYSGPLTCSLVIARQKLRNSRHDIDGGGWVGNDNLT